MIQVNITTSGGDPITNGVVADTSEGDAYVARMAGYWPAGFIRTDISYVEPAPVIDSIKASAMAKLKALGLTDAEIAAITGA